MTDYVKAAKEWFQSFTSEEQIEMMNKAESEVIGSEENPHPPIETGEENRWFLQEPCKHEIYKPGWLGAVTVMDEKTCPWCLQKRIAELETEVESQKHCYRLLEEHRSGIAQQLADANKRIENYEENAI